MKTLYRLYDKNKINTLPVEEFPGKIIVIYTEAEAEKAVNYLLSQPILGIDTETKPVFRKGVSHSISLLQVSSPEICFLFRLNMMGIPPCLIRLLSDKNVTKVGLSLKDDFMKLYEVSKFEKGNFVDLQDLVYGLGLEDKSLQKLYANFFGKKISKSSRLSNWDADVLTSKQQSYAAIDAWACIELYRAMEQIHRTGDFEVITQTPQDKE